MSLYAYVREAYLLREELIESLNEEDIEVLRREIGGRAPRELFQLALSASEEVASYVSKTPSQRAKLQKYLPNEKRIWISYLSILALEMGTALLETSDSPSLQPGPGYRELAAKSIRLFVDLRKREYSWWPFDVPFDHDEA